MLFDALIACIIGTGTVAALLTHNTIMGLAAVIVNCLAAGWFLAKARYGSQYERIEDHDPRNA